MDSDSTKRINTDDQAVKEIAHWIVLTAIHHPMLLALKGKLDSDLARNEDVIKLEELGCDKSRLLNVLAFTNAMPSLYPPLEANTLRKLAKDLRGVFQRMKVITPSSALPWIKENAVGRQFLTWVPTGGDLHIWPDLETEVQRRADMYSELARLCAQRKVPSRATFRKFAYLWPVQYVNSTLQEPHYVALSKLLAHVGIDKNPKQLKVAFKSVQEEYPGLLKWMDLAANLLHETAVFLSSTMTIEPFVDADEAGKFLLLNRRRILELARAGKLPGHPIGDGTRRVWRFRLSELANTLARNVFTSQNDSAIRRPSGAPRRRALKLV
ncbi:MAG: helix-turn-helix domain-containing protein [Terriglobales bacterium]